MTMLETMQERIRAAIPATEIGEPKGKWQSINEKLALINDRASIPGRGSVEDIFPLENRRNRDFLFEKIGSPDAANKAIETFDGAADPDERWKYRDWLTEAVEKGMTVIAVRRKGDDEVAGFSIFFTALEVADYKSIESDPRIVLGVDLEAVYLSPSYRGRGYSEALSWATAKHVESITDLLNGMTADEREPVEGLELEIFVRGEAHSRGGSRFLAKVVEEINCNVEMDCPADPWLGMPVITDDIDYDEYRLFEDDDDAVSTPTP